MLARWPWSLSVAGNAEPGAALGRPQPGCSSAVGNEAITAGVGSSPLSGNLTGGGEVIRERLFELEEADRVVVGIGEPGREREPDVGDAADGVQLRKILDLDAARPETGDLGGDVVHAPGGP